MLKACPECARPMQRSRGIGINTEGWRCLLCDTVYFDKALVETPEMTRLCPDCGYQMRQMNDDYGYGWQCGLCGTEYFDKELRPVERTDGERERLRDAVIAAARKLCDIRRSERFSFDENDARQALAALDAFEKENTKCPS